MPTRPQAAAEARRYPARPIVGVGGVAFIDGRVVLIKRRFEPLAGRWSLPGGTLELGETLHEGLVARDAGGDGARGRGRARSSMCSIASRATTTAACGSTTCWSTTCAGRVGGTLAPGSDVAEVALAAVDDLARYDLTPKTIDVITAARRLRALSP